jgi:polar amino acid transport system substrate-binding protein
MIDDDFILGDTMSNSINLQAQRSENYVDCGTIIAANNITAPAASLGYMWLGPTTVLEVVSKNADRRNGILAVKISGGSGNAALEKITAIADIEEFPKVICNSFEREEQQMVFAKQRKPDVAHVTYFSRIKAISVIAAILLLAIAPRSLVAQSLTEPMYLSNATLPPVTTEAKDGYLDKILNEMFARAGMRYELVNVPPARGLRNANLALFDGDAARIELDPNDFENLIKVPEPIIYVTFAGLYYEPISDVQAWDGFAEYRIGYVRGWNVFARIFAQHKNSTVVANAEALLNMLERDRIDYAFLTVAPARYLAAEKGMRRPSVTKIQRHVDLFLYLNKKHTDKVGVLNDALLSMKADGTYDAIISSYIPGAE